MRSDPTDPLARIKITVFKEQRRRQEAPSKQTTFFNNITMQGLSPKILVDNPSGSREFTDVIVFVLDQLFVTTLSVLDYPLKEQRSQVAKMTIHFRSHH